MSTSGRIPPQNLDAEASVLGAILIEGDSIVKIDDILAPECFYDQTHQLIFEAMEQLYEARQPIDVVTLTGALKKNKTLQKAGGTAALAKLSSTMSTAANIEHYAALVREAYLKRRLISVGAEMTELAFDDTKAVADIMDSAEQQVFAMSQVQRSRSFLPIKDTLVESFERLDELQKSGSDLRGLSAEELLPAAAA